MASQNGNGPVVELLLVKGKADPNKATKDGHTPLFIANQQGHRPVVKLLLQHGADPSARTKKGNTPADHAKGSGHTAIAQLVRTPAEARLERSKELFTQAMCGNVSEVERLLATGCDVNWVRLLPPISRSIHNT